MINYIKAIFTYGFLITGFMLTSTLWGYILLVVLKKLRYVI